MHGKLPIATNYQIISEKYFRNMKRIFPLVMNIQFSYNYATYEAVIFADWIINCSLYSNSFGPFYFKILFGTIVDVLGERRNYDSKLDISKITVLSEDQYRTNLLVEIEGIIEFCVESPDGLQFVKDLRIMTQIPASIVWS